MWEHGRNSMGVSLRQAAHLERELGHELASFLFDPKHTGQVREFLRGLVATSRRPNILHRFPNARIRRESKLTVDRTGNPSDLLLAERDKMYEWMKSHHPAWKASGVTTETVVLIDMGDDYRRDDALSVIEAFGLTPCPDNATLWTFSNTHVDLQQENWILDPGTVWRDRYDDSCVAIMCGLPGYRRAYLGRVNEGGRDIRVIALRGKPPGI